MALAEMPAAPLVKNRTAAPKLWTYEDYLTSPLIKGSYEFIDGEFIAMPGAGKRHQFIVVRLVGLFLTFEDQTKIGRTLTAPCDVVIQRKPLRTRQPDVLFITNERLEEAGGADNDDPLEVGPELIVEVISPSETRRTVMKKLGDYQSVGVKEAWLLSREAETIEVLQLSEAGIQTVTVYVTGQTCPSVAVPGLSVVLADVFG